jgi:tetratricopeptide (TPR) repeat protein
VEHLQAAEMQVPKHAPTQSALEDAATALEERGREALDEAYVRAVSNPGDLEAQLTLMRELQSLGRVEDAVQLMQANDRRFENRAEWHAEFAVNLVLLNRVDEAVQRYHRSLSLAEDVNTMVELAMLLLERRRGDDLSEADRLSVAALKRDPESLVALVCRAEVLALGGNLAAAQTLYGRAIETLPRDDARRGPYIERAKALGLADGE